MLPSSSQQQTVESNRQILLVGKELSEMMRFPFSAKSGLNGFDNMPPPPRRALKGPKGDLGAQGTPKGTQGVPKYVFCVQRGQPKVHLGGKFPMFFEDRTDI